MTTALSALDRILAECRELSEDIEFSSVHQWKKENPDGKVLGHFQVYFPEEIAHAAGMLPIKIMGAGTRIEAKQADSRLGSFICSIIRTSLELGLSGRLSFLDAFVTHPICDCARNLAGIWGRNFPNQLSQILYLPQHANSRYAPTYLRDEYARLKGDLEHRIGRAITDDDLRNSIQVFNENRRLLRELYAIKRDTPWLLTAEEGFVLLKAGTVIPREKHNEMLKTALAEIKKRNWKKQDKVRIVFEGAFCETPPLDMLQTIQETCYIVDDDFLIGARWITEDVPTDGDPLYNLAHSYVHTSEYSPVQHDDNKPKEKMLIKRVKEAGAEAAIVAAAKMCEPGLDEMVAYSKGLDEEHIPHLIVEFEEKMTTFEQLRMQVETFVESILFD